MYDHAHVSTENEVLRKVQATTQHELFCGVDRDFSHNGGEISIKEERRTSGGGKHALLQCTVARCCVASCCLAVSPG